MDQGEAGGGQLVPRRCCLMSPRTRRGVSCPTSGSSGSASPTAHPARSPHRRAFLRRRRVWRPAASVRDKDVAYRYRDD